MSSNDPYISVFARQRPTCCASCRQGLACENSCHNHGVPGVDPAVPALPPTAATPALPAVQPIVVTQLAAAPTPPRAGAQAQAQTQAQAQGTMSMHARNQGPNENHDGYCGQVGSPYPCRPYVDPRTGKIPGAPMPVDKIGGCETYEEAVKRLCWVETTFRSQAPVPAGAPIVFEFEVKWWFQIQSILNLGDQANATFDLTNIGYGQSNYNLEMHDFTIDGIGVAQSGIDVRRWNIEMFDKFYPMPAAGLNDPVSLTFANVSALAADLELVVGGPAVLQIG